MLRCAPAQEAFNDALYFKDEALRAFKLGILSLEERAQVRARRLTPFTAERSSVSGLFWKLRV